jgi:hypothetical protein
MKTISKIAKECGLSFYTVQRIVVDEKITTIQASTKLVLTEIQADHIQQVLYNKNYFQYLTLESKMNFL